MAAHLGAKGVTLFGHHTTPKKVSIETNKFKAIIKDDLKELSVKKFILIFPKNYCWFKSSIYFFIILLHSNCFENSLAFFPNFKYLSSSNMFFIL